MSKDNQKGDQAFRNDDATGTWVEMTYGGALSFARRRYSRDLAGVDIVVSGIPYDNAVTLSIRLPPRATRHPRRVGAACRTETFSFWV